jgi:hypothetical protein
MNSSGILHAGSNEPSHPQDLDDIEDSEAWHNPDMFSSDFYRPQDDVTRGVSMGESVHLHDLQPNITDLFAGTDFYRDDMTEELSGGALGFSKKFVSADDSSALGKNCMPLVRGFTEIDLPPDVPGGLHFKFEVNTLLVVSAQPHEIMNAMLEFLTTKVPADIIKVRKPSETNFQKCSIKAEVISRSLACTVKIRFYRMSGELPAFAVEFQRHSGDSLAFNTTFQEAATFLTLRFGSEAVVTGGSDKDLARLQAAFHGRPGESSGIVDSLEAGVPARGADENHEEDEEDEELFLTDLAYHEKDERPKGPKKMNLASKVAPLLDMAGLSGSPALRAEAATALADLARDGQAAACLCTERAFEAFKQLLDAACGDDGEATSSTTVDYHTALLLERLAGCPEAVPCFVEHGILELVLRKVQSLQSREVGSLAQRQLVKAFSRAAPRCAVALDGPTRESLHAGLLATESGFEDSVLQAKDATARLEFQEALLALKTS